MKAPSPPLQPLRPSFWLFVRVRKEEEGSSFTLRRRAGRPLSKNFLPGAPHRPSVFRRLGKERRRKGGKIEEMGEGYEYKGKGAQEEGAVAKGG